MRVVFAGTPEAAVPSLRQLAADPELEVVAVFTRPPARSGRGRKQTDSPVAVAAGELGIPVYTPRSVNEPAALEVLRELSPDICAIVAYGGLIRAEALTIPRHGWVNLHFSLLPQWRGAAPVQAAIAHGDQITGACTFQLEDTLDTGPVFGQVTERIARTDTAGDLLARLAVTGAGLLAHTLHVIADGTARPRPQQGESSYAPKLTTADAQIRWDLPAHLIDRQIRAHTPAPGAWTTVAGQRVKVLAAQLPTEATLTTAPAPALASGEIAADRQRLWIGTADVPLEVLSVQPAGKRAMAAADWARGANLEGTVCGR